MHCESKSTENTICLQGIQDFVFTGKVNLIADDQACLTQGGEEAGEFEEEE